MLGLLPRPSMEINERAGRPLVLGLKESPGDTHLGFRYRTPLYEQSFTPERCVGGLPQVVSGAFPALSVAIGTRQRESVFGVMDGSGPRLGVISGGS